MSGFQIPVGAQEQLTSFPLEPITWFQGPYRFLSNFHVAPIEIGPIMARFIPDLDPMEGSVVETNEHGFQLLKSLNLKERQQVRSARTPGEAKKLGGPHGIVTLREDWDEIRIPVMEALNLAKFVQHEDLRAKLLETEGRALIEGNAHNDRFWGVVSGVGENHQGKILERVRSHLS